MPLGCHLLSRGGHARVARWGILPIYVGQQDPHTGTDTYNPLKYPYHSVRNIDGNAAISLMLSGGVARWGILPIYVGQQDPHTGTDTYNPLKYPYHSVRNIDGNAAISLMLSGGFSETASRGR
jgi:hypothetical protein